MVGDATHGPGRRRGEQNDKPGTGNVVIAASAGLGVKMMVEGLVRDFVGDSRRG